MGYEDAETLRSPPDWDSKVWRYLSTTQLLSILEKHKLQFTRTDKFPDPYEGTLPDEILEHLNDDSTDEGLPESARKDFEGEIILEDQFNSIKTFNKTFFHNCWNYKNYESKPMWDSKSKDGEGLAIVSTADRLKQSFNINDHLFIGLVEYEDYQNDVVFD